MKDLYRSSQYGVLCHNSTLSPPHAASMFVSLGSLRDVVTVRDGVRIQAIE